jgi:hypothetical protein
VAPDAGAVKSTETPGTALPPRSFTIAIRGLAYAVPIVAVCPPPLATETLAAGPGRLVNPKVAAVPTPDTLAVIVNPPAIVFAAKAGDVACPFVLVDAVAVSGPPNEPLAAEGGAVKVTVTPERRFPPESFTVTTRGLYAAEIIAVCPLFAGVTDAGDPTVFVKENCAGAVTPDTVALML